jgi:hypothetical protein
MMRMKTDQRGVALLITVLVVSVVLSVALSVANVAVKALQITSASRESVHAVYMADAGIECALYWDVRGVELTGAPVFVASTADTPPPAGSNIDCFGGIDITNVWTVIPAANASIIFFDLEHNNRCARLLIEKGEDLSNPGRVVTSILSRGYNVPCAQVGTSPNAVERAIRVRY